MGTDETAIISNETKQKIIELCFVIRKSSYRELGYIWNQVDTYATEILAELEKPNAASDASERQN